MRRFVAFCMFLSAVTAGVVAKAQRLHQEVFGTLFNTGLYITEDVYARQFHERSAATGNSMRLLHIADAFYNGGMWHNSNDSTTLVYSGVRGWDAVLDEWAYDTLHNYIVSLPAHREYGTDGRTSMNYYGFNQNLPQRRVFAYASNGKVASYTHEELQGGSQWVATAQYNYSYDATYRRIQQASANERVVYNYDINHLQNIETSKNVNGTWKLSTISYYNYDTIDGRLREIVHATRLPNGNDYETDRTAYAYDWNGKVTNMYRIINKSILVKDTVRTTYTYNDSGYIATMTTQKVREGVDSNVQRIELRYNYMHQVVSELYQYWSNSGQVWMYEKQKRYHYTIVFPLHVAGKSSGVAPELDIYPLPAGDHLTISLTNTGTGNATVTLLNTNGALLREWRYSNMGGDFKQELSLSGVAAGNYVMHVATDAGTVARQVVVK